MHKVINTNVCLVTYWFGYAPGTNRPFQNPDLEFQRKCCSGCVCSVIFQSILRLLFMIRVLQGCFKKSSQVQPMTIFLICRERNNRERKQYYRISLKGLTNQGNFITLT